ncbi:MAG: thiamine pyrophosphate-dependent dehydrogenase E1 component subunit alpha [Rickettsiales bacterium]
MKTFSKEKIASLYKQMLLIRKFEEHIVNVYHTDVIKSPVHLSIGQEAVSVAICDPLEKDDIVSNTYRCHGTYIAKGGDLKSMMAELYGKQKGCAGGKAGSMHLVDIKNGIMGSSAVVGTTVPVATGYALEMKMNHKNNVVASVFGDGATEEGCINESINFASIHKLPIIYICENNGLAIHSPIKKRWATDDLCTRMQTYGLKTFRIKDNNIFDLIKTVKEAREFALNPNNPPVFIECFTYRYLEHVGITDDHHEEYRDINELKKWQKHDQIVALSKLIELDIAKKIDQEVDSIVDECARYAESSKFPEELELYRNVYAK